MEQGDEQKQNVEKVAVENGEVDFSHVLPGGVDLMSFCAAHHDLLAEPFSYDGYTVFCNGHIAVRIDGVDGVVRDPPFEQYKEIDWKVPDGGEWLDIAAVEVEKRRCHLCVGTGKTTVCVECDGEGEVSWNNNHHTYEAQCKSCHGDSVLAGGFDVCENCNGSGEVINDRYKSVFINDVKFTASLVAKIQELPGMALYSEPIRQGMYLFKFTHGDGVIMAKRQR